MADRNRWRVALTLLIAASLSCSLPGLVSPTSPPPTATVAKSAAPAERPTPPPLPPSLLETEPSVGAWLEPNESLTFHFDQEMEPTSVLAGFHVDPEVKGALNWEDARTLVFTPDQPLDLDSRYLVTFDQLTSANGLTAEAPASATFQTAPFLEITQVQPAPASAAVSTTADIRVAFNQPVVPLDLSGDRPQPLRFDPPIQGSGEWVGSSLYVFHPSPAIPAGRGITATVDSSLAAVSGGRMRESFEWTFNSAVPHVVTSEPAGGASGIELNPEITLTFNQPISKGSLEGNMAVRDEQGTLIRGGFEWSDDASQVVFTPNDRLDYSTRYDIGIAGTTGPAGTPLEGPQSFSFTTASPPSVLAAFPGPNTTLGIYASPYLQLTAPMDQASLLQNLSVSPQVENFGGSWNPEERKLFVHGQFEAGRQYTLTLGAAAEDQYGTALGDSYSYSFQVGDYPPRVDFTQYNDVLTFSATRPTEVELQARNIDRIDLQLYQLSLGSYLAASANSYELLYNVDRPGELIRSWSYTVPAKLNVDQSLRIALSDSGPLPTGVYVLRMDSPQDLATTRGRFVIVRGTELLVKSTVDEVFVWASDLESGQSLPDFTVHMVNGNGADLNDPAHGQDGIAHLPAADTAEPYDPIYLIHGQPGEPDFGITSWMWTSGIEPYLFGVASRVRVQTDQDYLYTDRPLYRAGQTVNFHGVLRSREHDQYVLPQQSSVEITLSDPHGETLETLELPLSSFGTYSGSVELPTGATLGTYLIQAESGSVSFRVAAYRKPTFSVEVQPSDPDRIVGEPLRATIRARYFFGAPVANQEVSWRAFGDRYYPPDLPFGVRYGWAGPAQDGGVYLADGSGVTDSNGQLTIDIPTDVDPPRPIDLTIEATISQDGDLPVSGRANVRLHPASVYLSLVPEEYSYRVGSTSLVRLHAADIHGNAISGQQATVRVFRVTWEQTVDGNGNIEWQSKETRVNQDQLSSAGDGSVLFSFVPQQAGTYRVEAETEDDEGRTATGSTTLWVVGQAAGIWRQASANTITLVPDRSSYQPGDTAQVLVPSPFDRTAVALVTVERDTILRHELIEIPPEGRLLPFDLGLTDAPNVYISINLLKPAGEDGPAALASGLAELIVSAERQRLTVELTPDRREAQPGERVTYRLNARNAAGDPVKAEFSLAMVDAALLSLTEPNSLSPFEALWGERPLGVRTAASLALSGEQHVELNEGGGRGGGGGDDIGANQVRKDFEDTAYWNPSILTDESGQAEVEIQLPDNLTTWKTEVRGVTVATEAGSAIDQIVVSKPLLIEPVTPRFLTAGDRVQVAGVVHNNTGQALSVDVSLQATGATIAQAAETTITLGAGDSERVTWDLSIGSGEAVGLTFSAQGGGYRDSSTPTIGSAIDGALPVLRYTAAGTVATSGWLPAEGSRTESVSTPNQFDPKQGELAVSIEPGVGALIQQGLQVIEANPFESSEAMASRLLGLESGRQLAMSVDLQSGPSVDDLEGRMQQTVYTLLDRQSNGGGWGWWPQASDNTFVTAHVTHALLVAQASGSHVEPNAISRATDVLLASLGTPAALDPNGLAEQAYVLTVLREANAVGLAPFAQLAAERDRLPTAALALVIQALSQLAPNDASLPALTADLESRAVLSATGTHWDREGDRFTSFEGAVSVTAHSIQALLQVAPGSPSIQGALRWLASARDRDGGWPSSYQDAWALQALADWAERTDTWQTDFDYHARLNGQVQAEGRFAAGELPSAVQLRIPISELAADRPNALTLDRGPGAGALAYSAHLTAYQPAEAVPAANHGLTIERRYYLDDGDCDLADAPCQPAESVKAGDDLLVRLTLIVPADSYRVAAVDRYPAGAEPIDPGLSTSQYRPQPSLPRFDFSWLGWYFSQIEIQDDRISLFADYLPAGTYSYVYRLHASFAGSFRVMPARTWLVYFPEVYGQTAGDTLTIAGGGQP